MKLGVLLLVVVAACSLNCFGDEPVGKTPEKLLAHKWALYLRTTIPGTRKFRTYEAWRDAYWEDEELGEERVDISRYVAYQDKERRRQEKAAIVRYIRDVRLMAWSGRLLGQKGGGPPPQYRTATKGDSYYTDIDSSGRTKDNYYIER